jgi:hypothetical protein
MSDKRPMSATEYRCILQRLDLTQLAAARLFGYTDRTSRTFARIGVSRAWAIVIRAYAHGKLDQADLH